MSIRILITIASNIRHRRQHKNAMLRLGLCCHKNAHSALLLHCIIYSATTRELLQSVATYQVHEWNEHAPQLQIPSAMTINYQVLMKQKHLSATKCTDGTWYEPTTLDSRVRRATVLTRSTLTISPTKETNLVWISRLNRPRRSRMWNETSLDYWGKGCALQSIKESTAEVYLTAQVQ